MNYLAIYRVKDTTNRFTKREEMRFEAPDDEKAIKKAENYHDIAVKLRILHDINVSKSDITLDSLFEIREVTILSKAL